MRGDEQFRVCLKFCMTIAGHGLLVARSSGCDNMTASIGMEGRLLPEQGLLVQRHLKAVYC